MCSLVIATFNINYSIIRHARYNIHTINQLDNGIYDNDI